MPATKDSLLRQPPLLHLFLECLHCTSSQTLLEKQHDRG